MKRISLVSLVFFLPLFCCAQTKISVPQLPVLPSNSLWFTDYTGKLVPVKTGPFITIDKTADGTFTLNITVSLSTTPLTRTFFATAGQRVFTVPVDYDLSKALVYRNGILQNMESGVATLPDYSINNSTHQVVFTDGIDIQPDDIIKVII